jgi:hypothetical protein
LAARPSVVGPLAQAGAQGRPWACFRLRAEKGVCEQHVLSFYFDNFSEAIICI